MPTPTSPRKQFLSKSKIAPPASISHEIKRLSILGRAIDVEARKLIVLQAPAGYGKSTCMQQIYADLAAKNYINIWLNLESGDNDLSRFLTSFAHAIAPYTQERKRIEEGDLRNEELAHIIFETLNQVDRPTAVFFDNFDAIRSPAVNGLISRGIESVPSDCHVIIGTRTLPNIGMSRLRAKELLTEFNANDLRFSYQETESFLVENQINEMRAEHLERLHESTEGWAVALKLAALALSNEEKNHSYIENFSGSNTAVATYLAEEVLSSLPEHVQEFLLDTSILEEMSPSLCDEICGRNDSYEILQELEQRNLFLTTIGDGRDLFRYHALFRDFLQNQLRRKRGKDARSLHESACQAYLELERPIPAIRHALLADNKDRAIELLSQHIDNLLKQGRIGLLTSLLGQLDQQTLTDHPYLKMIYALCLTFSKGPHQAYQLIENLDSKDLPAKPAAYLLALRPMQLAMMDQIEEAHAQGTEAVKLVGDEHRYAQATLAQALTQTSIILGEHNEARQFCDQVRFIQGQHSAAINIALAESAEALMDIMNGHLKQATSRLRTAIDGLNDSSTGSNRGVALTAIQLAEALYENNQCDQAKLLLTTNSALVQDIGPPDTLITAHIVFCRISESEGDLDHALQLLIELENSGHRLNLPRVVASARLERARIWLSQGDAQGCLDQLELAEQTYDWDQAQSLWYSANDTLTPDILRARWKIRNGQADEALSGLREQLKGAERINRMRRALKLRILLSEALYVTGETKSALRHMQQAIEFADAEGYARTFIEEGDSLDPILSELHKQQLTDKAGDQDGNGSYLGLWEQKRPKTQINESANNLVEPLTAKELQVLNVLSLGLSNNAMGEKLFISESTVRTHLRNINLKLDAKNRTEAVSIARQMGLIDL